jgi:hypothetical protein
MHFTIEELALLARYAEPEARKSRTGFYVAWISPILMFGAYGFIQQDFVALTVALLGALGNLFWVISNQSTSTALFQSIAAKVLKIVQEGLNPSEGKA